MKKFRILMVEDDAEMCEELIPILEEEGFLIDVAHDGKNAIIQVEKNEFGLVLLDLKMPKINGYEVLKYIKKSHPAMKVIVLSGSPLRPGMLKAEEQIFPGGKDYQQLITQLADGFINKPFDIEQLLAAVHKILPKQEE